MVSIKTIDNAQKIVATLSGLKRWKEEKAGFGTLVCEDEDDHWFFQIPTNIRVYDVEYRGLKTATIQGNIRKEDGRIEFIVQWGRMGESDIEEYDISKKYHSYPILDDYGNYNLEWFRDPERAKKFLGWN